MPGGVTALAAQFFIFAREGLLAKDLERPLAVKIGLGRYPDLVNRRQTGLQYFPYFRSSLF